MLLAFAVVVLGVALLGALVYIRLLRVDMGTLREAQRGEIAAREHAFKLIVNDLNERHAEELKRTTSLYDRLVETQGRTTQDAIRLMTTGATQPVPPEIAEREVDPQTRVARRVAEETIERGVSELRDAYRGLGIATTDEELREEVELLLLQGTVPHYPHEPSGNGVPQA